jgi:hypothetical protein
MPACIQKPEGLPPISDVVLDKVSRVIWVLSTDRCSAGSS